MQFIEFFFLGMLLAFSLGLQYRMTFIVDNFICCIVQTFAQLAFSFMFVIVQSYTFWFLNFSFVGFSCCPSSVSNLLCLSNFFTAVWESYLFLGCFFYVEVLWNCGLVFFWGLFLVIFGGWTTFLLGLFQCIQTCLLPLVLQCLVVVGFVNIQQVFLHRSSYLLEEYTFRCAIICVLSILTCPNCSVADS